MIQRALGLFGVITLLVAIVITGALASEPKAFLESGDWQYAELDALGQAGLLSGHPQGPIGVWAGDRLTRYEAASLAVRAVQGLGGALERQGQTLYEIARGEAPADTPVTFHLEDLARVEKLIQEFRAELVSMGLRVDDLFTTLSDMQTRIAKVEAEQRRHRLDGYFQVRYRDDQAADKKEFLVRRARFNVRGPVSERVSYRLELQMDAREDGKGPTSKTQLRTLYADYAMDNGRLRIGQAKIPWGYELLASVPDLWAGERALFMDRLFPDQRDIGVQWSYQVSPCAPRFDVGIFNGTGINASDNNDRKNLMARVDFPFPNGSFALSGYVGKDGEGEAATDQDRYGVSAQYAWPVGTRFLGEYVLGKDRGSDVRGYYLQLGHPLVAGPTNLLFVKLDRYDEDTGMGDNLFRRWSFGYWYELDPATRLTLVHERRQVGENFSEFSRWDGNATYLQLQVKY